MPKARAGLGDDLKTSCKGMTQTMLAVMLLAMHQHAVYNMKGVKDTVQYI